jgi:hypothetical protein
LISAYNQQSVIFQDAAAARDECYAQVNALVTTFEDGNGMEQTRQGRERFFIP